MSELQQVGYTEISGVRQIKYDDKGWIGRFFDDVWRGIALRAPDDLEEPAIIRELRRR